MNFKAFGFICSVAGVAIAALAAPASAHHSFAMFDAANPMTMTGTVQEFLWSNPHSWLRVMIEDEATGRPLLWAFELGSPVQQTRVGWSADSLKPGDNVTVLIHPSKDGARQGGLITATLPDGSTLGNGGLRPNSQRSSKFPGGLAAGVFGSGDVQPTPQDN
ncbi:MAG: DUF6152 family protein [Micropepsaceae bacterium]